MNNAELERYHLVYKFYVVFMLVGLILFAVQICAGIALYPFIMMACLIAITIVAANLSRFLYLVDRMYNEEVTFVINV